MVYGASRILLPASPGDKRVRADVESHLPIALVEQRRNPHLELPRPSPLATRPISFHQISEVILQMRSKRPTGSYPNQFRFEDARRFSLFFLNEFLRPFFGYLSVRHP